MQRRATKEIKTKKKIRTKTGTRIKMLWSKTTHGNPGVIYGLKRKQRDLLFLFIIQEENIVSGSFGW